MTRRDFVTMASGAVVAGAAGLALAAAEQGPSEPKHKPWVVACRDQYLKLAGKPDCWSAMKELGAGGAEVDVTIDLACPGLFHPTKKYSLDSSDAIASLKADLLENGLAITAFCMYNRFDEQLEKELACARKIVAASRVLGVPVIRIDLVPRALKRDEFLPFAVKTGKALVEIASDSSVRYGIENHGNTTNDPAFLEKLFDGVGSPRLGLTLDSANLYWFGHPVDDVYKICEKFAARAVHTHTKNIRYPEDKRNARRPMGWEYGKHAIPVYDGDLDYRRIAKILRAAGYAGDLCLEDESLHSFPATEHAAIVKKELAFLKTL